jgi:hypothetical protein
MVRQQPSTPDDVLTGTQTAHGMNHKKGRRKRCSANPLGTKKATVWHKEAVASEFWQMLTYEEQLLQTRGKYWIWQGWFEK